VTGGYPDRAGAAGIKLRHAQRYRFTVDRTGGRHDRFVADTDLEQIGWPLKPVTSSLSVIYITVDQASTETIDGRALSRSLPENRISLPLNEMSILLPCRSAIFPLSVLYVSRYDLFARRGPALPGYKLMNNCCRSADIAYPASSPFTIGIDSRSVSLYRLNTFWSAFATSSENRTTIPAALRHPYRGG